MSGSFRLNKRKKEGCVWSFGNNEWSDHYIRPWGDCHPDFTAIPIGNPDGIKVCVRKGTPGSERLVDPPYGESSYGPGKMECDGDPNQSRSAMMAKNVMCANGKSSFPYYMTQFNGYTKFASNLYDPGLSQPIQLYNPDYYAERRPPEQQYDLEHDYYKIDVRYNSTGIIDVNTPRKDGTYHEYGVDYMKNPPARYDVTHLQQLYPIWENRQ